MKLKELEWQIQHIKMSHPESLDKEVEANYYGSRFLLDYLKEDYWYGESGQDKFQYHNTTIELEQISRQRLTNHNTLNDQILELQNKVVFISAAGISRDGSKLYLRLVTDNNHANTDGIIMSGKDLQIKIGHIDFKEFLHDTRR